MKRVVITGIGLITAFGSNLENNWNQITQGNSGIKKIPESLFHNSDLACRIAGYIPTKEESTDGFAVEDWIDSKTARSMDRFIHLAMAAASQAVADSGWICDTDEKKLSTGVLIGSGIGGLNCIENNVNILRDKGPRRISPYFIPASLINLIAGHISIKYGYKGPNYSVVTACATASHSIGESARLIKCNEAKVMIAGGSEAAICRLGIAGFTAARALSTNYNDDPSSASRPWDKNRDGFVMGEGAGILVLEELEHAKARKARIYAELIGYGLSSDAHHITAPEPRGDGGYRAMQIAITQGAINLEDIDYINAHGTSTPLGDMIELEAVKRILGHDNIKNVVMSSTKSAIGHLLGAAGGVEAIFSLLAMRDGICPPTLNLEEPEEECNDINLAPKQAVEQKVDIALSNSFGFGGTNASLLFKKY